MAFEQVTKMWGREVIASIPSQEPVFVLRASDGLKAAYGMRCFAQKMDLEGGNRALVQEILEYANMAERWSKEHPTGVPAEPPASTQPPASTGESGSSPPPQQP